MEIKKLLACGALLTVALSSGTQVFAQDYPDSTHAKTEGVVTFLEDNSPIEPTDPTDPEKPLEPTDPTNPNGAELMIVYASNFKFGDQEKTTTSWQAMADEMKDGSKVTPFVVTKDSRGTDRKGWSLTAELSKDFTDTKGNTLAGAELELSNMFYTDKVTGAPAVTGGAVVLNNQAQEVAKADATQGIGSWSLGLGELQSDDTTNGVKLSVPLNSAKNTDTYTAEVTWELTADPSK